jgi:hypothetical protein
MIRIIPINQSVRTVEAAAARTCFFRQCGVFSDLPYPACTLRVLLLLKSKTTFLLTCTVLYYLLLSLGLRLPLQSNSRLGPFVNSDTVVPGPVDVRRGASRDLDCQLNTLELYPDSLKPWRGGIVRILYLYCTVYTVTCPLIRSNPTAAYSASPLLDLS